jgi:hypothetical protein
VAFGQETSREAKSMRRTSLTAAILAVSLAAVFFSGMGLGNPGEKERHGDKGSEFGVNVCSWQISWDSGAKYDMQWDETSKKLLFEGQAISHETPAPAYDRANAYGTIRGFRFRGASSIDLTPARKHPDQYSFDAGSPGASGVLSELNEHDGQLHYCLQWDDSKEWFVGCTPAPEEVKELFTFDSGFGPR